MTVSDDDVTVGVGPAAPAGPGPVASTDPVEADEPEPVFSTDPVEAGPDDAGFGAVADPADEPAVEDPDEPADLDADDSDALAV